MNEFNSPAYQLNSILENAPPLGSCENDADPVAFAKLFTPMSSFTWYVLEADQDGMCFGLVYSHNCPEGELGYFHLQELIPLRLAGIPAVEIDLYFTPARLSECREYQ